MTFAINRNAFIRMLGAKNRIIEVSLIASYKPGI